MSFGFRRSRQFGPLRFSLSKSGFSASLGAKGARITAGPRGTYVTFSKAGFYYRTRVSPLSGSAGNQEHAAVPPEAPDIVGANVSATRAPEPNPETFGDVSPDEFLRSLNQRINRRNYAIPLVAGVSSFVIVSWLLMATLADADALAILSLTWPIVATIGYLTSLFIGIQHARSRYTTLFYDSCDETERRMTAFHKAVSALQSAAIVWSVREVSPTTEIQARPSVLSRTKLPSDVLQLPHIRTNITPASLRLSDGTLYFLPDRLLIWHAGHFAAVDYSNLKLWEKRVRFLEREEPPRDTTVAGRMPRSLSTETKIPIFWYGMVDIDAAPALQLRLMTSRVENAQEFTAELQSVLGGIDSSKSMGDSAETLYTHFDSSHLPLFYELSAASIRRAQAIREAFEAILQSEYVWLYESQERTEEWKRNAGASSLVNRTRVSPVLVKQMPGFETNALIGLTVGNSTVYVLPDQCIVRTGASYQSIGKSLNVQTKSCSFREDDAAPRDSKIVGHTWRYVNKRGGPDLRFNNNRQIPIFRYGEILIAGEGSWRLHLCLSRAESAERFERLLRVAPDDEGLHDAPPETKGEPAEVANAFRVLGLQAGASFEEASAAYRNLARQNHPDKVAQLAPEFRELAEKRMREINAAFDQARRFFEARQ